MSAAHLICKLEGFTRLSRAEKEALDRAASLGQRRIGAREDLIREGSEPRRVHLVLDGWACRYEMLEDGRRQTTAFLIPGDLCDLRMSILKRMDHSIAAVSSLAVAVIPKDVILELTATHPRIGHALGWSSLVEEAIQRAWTTSLGRRDAVERLAHLFCELFLRLRAIGLTEGDGCELPLSQSELADATGLSTVHVNRTLQELRGEGLITLKGRTLTIPDLEALQTAALFDANYLHLEREGRALDSDDP